MGHRCDTQAGTRPQDTYSPEGHTLLSKSPRGQARTEASGRRKPLGEIEARQAGPAPYTPGHWGPPRETEAGVGMSGLPPLMAPWQEGARDIMFGKVRGEGTATRAGGSYQAAILGNSGVRTSWVKTNQAMAIRPPAMPP